MENEPQLPYANYLLTSEAPVIVSAEEVRKLQKHLQSTLVEDELHSIMRQIINAIKENPYLTYIHYEIINQEVEEKLLQLGFYTSKNEGGRISW